MADAWSNFGGPRKLGTCLISWTIPGSAPSTAMEYERAWANVNQLRLSRQVAWLQLHV